MAKALCTWECGALVQQQSMICPAKRFDWTPGEPVARCSPFIHYVHTLVQSCFALGPHRTRMHLVRIRELQKLRCEEAPRMLPCDPPRSGCEIKGRVYGIGEACPQISNDAIFF